MVLYWWWPLSKVILTLLMNMVLSLVVAAVRSSGPKLSQVVSWLCMHNVLHIHVNTHTCVHEYVWTCVVMLCTYVSVHNLFLKFLLKKQAPQWSSTSPMCLLVCVYLCACVLLPLYLCMCNLVTWVRLIFSQTRNSFQPWALQWSSTSPNCYFSSSALPWNNLNVLFKQWNTDVEYWWASIYILLPWREKP